MKTVAARERSDRGNLPLSGKKTINQIVSFSRYPKYVGQKRKRKAEIATVGIRQAKYECGIQMMDA